MPIDPAPEDRLGRCQICGREMLDGKSTDRHHWVPRSEGGGDWSYLHRVCHKKIHSLFSNDELANTYNTPEKIRKHPDMEIFIKWVRKRPIEYIGRHAKPRS